MNTQNLNADLASLKAIISKLQSSPGELTPLDQTLVNDLEARVASLIPDIPAYVPRVEPPGPMPAHSASPLNPSNPAFRPNLEVVSEADLPDAVNPAVAPNPTIAMTKVVGLPADLEPAPAETPVAKKAPAKAKVVKIKVQPKAKVAKRARRAA